MSRVTLADVAREAGVSLATASRAFNGSADRVVGEALRERVLEAATRLNYAPDANAQAVARGRTTMVGLIVHDIADPYFASIAAGVTAAADKNGLVVTLASTGNDPQRELSFVELLDRQRARAIILAGARLTEPTPAGTTAAGGPTERDAALAAVLEEYRRTGGGVATVGQAIGDLPAVVVANRAGAADLARAVQGHGYTSFAVLAGPPHNRTAADRTAGFLDVLGAGAASSAVRVVHSAFSRDGGYAAMTEVLAAPDRPRVVLATTDVMAMGAIAAARDAGLSVPADIAVTGFDDISTLRDVVPALTTVHIPLTTIGELAVQLSLATDDSDAPTREPIEGVVQLRESTPRLG